MSRDIVVGLDGSQSSTRALAHAVAEAKSSGRVVRAVHAWTTPVWMGVTGLGYNALASPADSKRYAEELLEQQLATFREHNDLGGVTLKPSTYEGDAKRVLVEASEGAALLVVGGRGAGQIRSLVMGSVSAYALHHVQCPVMVVPDPGSPSVVGQRVIVGVDGSAASRSAMRWALASARRHGCPLIVMHAWLLTSLPGRPPMHYVPSLREYETEAQEWLDKEVQEVLPDRHDVRVVSELSHSAASWALLDKAGPDDQLVVGSRGRGGFADLLLGSVASQCAQHARGVLVVVRAEQECLDA